MIKRLGNITVLALAAMGLLIASCKQSPEERIVGEWQTPGMQTVTFNPGGTLSISDKGITAQGRYSFPGGNRFEWVTEASKQIFTYSFRDENTLVFVTEGENPSADEFKRIIRSK
jgi:hypothetical protein